MASYTLTVTFGWNAHPNKHGIYPCSSAICKEDGVPVSFTELHPGTATVALNQKNTTPSAVTLSSFTPSFCAENGQPAPTFAVANNLNNWSNLGIVTLLGPNSGVTEDKSSMTVTFTVTAPNGTVKTFRDDPEIIVGNG